MLDDCKEIERKLINYGIALDSRKWDELNTIFSKDVSAVYGNEKIGMMIESKSCLLYTSPSPRDLSTSRMPSSA